MATPPPLSGQVSPPTLESTINDFNDDKISRSTRSPVVIGYYQEIKWFSRWMWCLASLVIVLVLSYTLSACYCLGSITSGEPLTRSLAQSFLSRYSTTTLLNLYGSTEVAGDVTYLPLPSSLTLSQWPEDDLLVPIGYPLPDTILRMSEEGEIMVTGPGLAKGYLRSSTSSKQEDDKFVDMDDTASLRWYRMGDRGEEREGGLWVYRGRMGPTAKVRGVRVEVDGVSARIRDLVKGRGMVVVLAWPPEGRTEEEGVILVAVMDQQVSGKNFKQTLFPYNRLW